MTFSQQGFELVQNFLSKEQLASFESEFQDLALEKSCGGIRSAEKWFSSVREFVGSDYAISQAKNYLNGSPQFVRAIVFNKTPENNWLVALHQDKTVALANKISDPSWGPWSTKSGVLHVQPPLEVLEAMVTFRIHIDETSEENGCLSVVPRSHKLGIISTAEIASISEQSNQVLCPAPAGSALVMRPHVLHSSSKASAPSKRRVLHVEYCSYKLPSETSWADSV